MYNTESAKTDLFSSDDKREIVTEKRKKERQTRKPVRRRFRLAEIQAVDQLDFVPFERGYLDVASRFGRCRLIATLNV